jgi:hypothetical protein
MPQEPIILDLAGEAVKQGLQGAENYDAPDAGFSIVFGNIFSIAMVIAALLVIGFMILGAIEWITSGGDKSKVEGARNKMTNAIIGILILSATVALFILLQQFLGLDVLTFG